MAILQKIRLLGNQRLDLTDFKNIDNFVCADFDQLFKRLYNTTTQVVRGFRIFQDALLSNPNPVTSPVYMELDGSVLLHTDLTQGPLFFVGAPGTQAAPLILTSGATNYIEIDLTTSTGSADIRTFWDPTANSGNGEEFAQTIDTVTNLDVAVSINTSGFTGGTKAPIAQIQVSGGGTITAMYDRRNLFFRLGRGLPYDDDFEFPFSDGRNEAIHTITLTGGAGVYSDGEIVTGGTSTTTAKVVTGGTTSITVTAKNLPAFTIGETLTGSTSGAARTIETVKEDFNSADKSISSLKDLIDGLMTEIVRIKFGTSSLQHYWFEDAPTSLQDARPELFMDGGGTMTWDSGSGALSFSDDFTIPITSTTFVNTILQSVQSPIVLDADGKLAFIDIDKTATVDIAVQTTAQTDYVPKQNRYIIARRVAGNTIIYDRLQ